MNKKSIHLLFISILTIVLLVFLFSQINPTDILVTLSQLSFRTFAVTFGLYSTSLILRSYRFHILLEKSLPLKKLTPIIAVHNMINNIMPLRSGELSYLYMLKKNDIRVPKSLATLITARIFDFIVILSFFIISTLFVESFSYLVNTLLALVSVVFILVLVGVLSLLKFGEKFITLIRRIFRKFNVEKTEKGEFILRKMHEGLGSFRSIHTKRILTQTFLLTVLIWSLQYSIMYLLAISFGIDLNFFAIIVIASLPIFAYILPIQGIAGLGTTEALWAGGVIFLGVSKELAISSGFAIHIIQIVFFLSIGLIGTLILKKQD